LQRIPLRTSSSLPATFLLV